MKMDSEKIKKIFRGKNNERKSDKEYRAKLSELKLGFWKNKILKRSQKNEKKFSR